jgi:tetratricopeptide (TPR) repeat protein
MSRIKYFVFVFLACFCSLIFAQDIGIEDKDLLAVRLQERISQAKLESDRGDYYDALENLNLALDFAKKLEDKKNEGIIHTKIAKLKYIVGETDSAYVSITTAIQLQRENNDYANLAVAYNIKGVFHSTSKEYEEALEYYNSAKNLFEQEDREEYISEVTLNEAKAYIALKRYEDAKAQLEKTIIISKKYDQRRRLSSALIQSGKVSSALNNNDLALTQVEEGLSIAKAYKISKNINEAYITLSDIYKEIKTVKNPITTTKKLKPRNAFSK